MAILQLQGFREIKHKLTQIEKLQKTEEDDLVKLKWKVDQL